ncbi:MAG TPA: helix-turn-helix transcriptional regulator [Pedobacter sp.]|jgi:transcriptional regulator with XRE-family HTH domain
MKSFRDYLNEKLQDKKFALEYQKASDDIDFALTLIKRREELKLTQQDLAERTGIKQPMIARIERGQIPTVPTLHRIADALLARVVITGSRMLLEQDDTIGESLQQLDADIELYQDTGVLTEYCKGSFEKPTAIFWGAYNSDLTVSHCLNASDVNVQDYLDRLDNDAKSWQASRLGTETSSNGNMMIVIGNEVYNKEVAEVAGGLIEKFKPRGLETKQREEATNAELALAA